MSERDRLQTMLDESELESFVRAALGLAASWQALWEWQASSHPTAPEVAHTHEASLAKMTELAGGCPQGSDPSTEATETEGE